MRVRSWLIRGLILAGVAALAVLVWLANSWISPERVREKVVVTLAEQFEGVDVQVGSARLRILGGIAVTDLRLTRRSSSANEPFLVVPSAILYHDKEQLNRGRLVIRKVELENLRLHLERSADGKWNVAEMVKPSTADKPVPTFVIKGATVSVVDNTPGSLPPTTFTDVQCTLLNDPLPMLTVQAVASAKQYGPVNLRGRLNRINNHLALSVELAEFPLGEAAVPTAQRFAPELAPHLAKLSAVANVKADLTYAPEAKPQWRHDVRFDVKEARFEHPDLPWPVEKIHATVRSTNGRVKVDDATAQVGQAKLKLSLETRVDTAPSTISASAEDPLRRIEDRLQRLDVSVADVPLDNGLFDRLPEKVKKGRRMFNPTGSVDLTYKFAREAAGWKRDLELKPKQATMMYEKFRYPVSELHGTVKRTTTHAGVESTTIELWGTAAGQLISMNGTVDGTGDDPAIKLRITGTNVPIDEQMYAAFPPKYATIVRELRATGRGNFVAEINQRAGVNLSENEFRIDIKDAKLNYTAFPYPLEKLEGTLVLRTTTTDATRPVRPGEEIRALPNRDEIIFHRFTAAHAGAPVWMNGEKKLVPDSRDHKLIVNVGGTNVPLNAELKAALGAVKAEHFWTSFSPRGQLTFTARVEVLDRAPSPDRPDFDPPLDPATDVTVTFGFAGPTVTPQFFPYELTELSGWLKYEHSQLAVARLEARHGLSRIKLAEGDVRFDTNGTVWAKLEGLEMKPCIPDEELRRALPGKLGAALNDIQLKGGAELFVKNLTVKTLPSEGGERKVELGIATASSPPTPIRLPASEVYTPVDPIIYWNAELKLFGASLDTGVPWENVFGSVACVGRYEGTHMGLLCGNIWLERAVVSGMPLGLARCQVRADPQEKDPARPGYYLPSMLQFRNVAGDLFHGALGGEANVVLADSTRYQVWLTATDVQLEEVARHYKLGSEADLKGIAQAQLLLTNKPDPRTGRLLVEGDGKIDVPTGRMYNLPVLLDIVKVFKGSAPDKTAFEEAHVVFTVHGDRVKVDQLDLIGKAICLGGSGELDTSGDYVKFEFYTVWSQVLKQMINTPVGDLTAFLSKNLYTIKMVRENGELKYKSAPVPLITEPTKAVLDRLKRGAGKLMGK